ncbi:MAG: UDP-N-acetylmuramoyl-L-alanine--D-glutamate ligase [Alphaproteobacteria bacterium]|nr:UDP-N-acetylmuramoyl-L-alanine--D-glutamate ligase [Alphaproteobacteria bacterium]
MTPVTSFKGRNVALFGLGGSGFATARALLAGGASVTAWDDNAMARARAVNAGIDVSDLARADWGNFDCLVLTPGVPLTHPEPHWSAKRALERGIEIIGDIELFCRERAAIAPDAPFVAITGTNGKSTTTSLIAHIFQHAGYDVQLGGNIGTPVLELDLPANERVHVLEVSSYQIDLAPSLSPSVGILINLTSDHIDRHGSMENYAAVKERLIMNAQRALIGVDDPHSWAIGERRAAKSSDHDARTVPVSARSRLRQGVFLQGAQVISTLADSAGEMICDLSGIASLRGAHNGQNAAFACACALMWGLPRNEIATAVKTFPGLPHRMEQTARAGHVLFVNDSKATNADAAEKALLSFRNIYWIAGGQAKEGGIASLMQYMDRVSKAYLIGAAADAFAQMIGDRVPSEISRTLDQAIEAAARDARAANVAEAVVLLSPACASFDQFANYGVRGDAFRDISLKLAALSGNTRSKGD